MSLLAGFLACGFGACTDDWAELFELLFSGAAAATSVTLTVNANVDARRERESDGGVLHDVVRLGCQWTKFQLAGGALGVSDESALAPLERALALREVVSADALHALVDACAAQAQEQTFLFLFCVLRALVLRGALDLRRLPLHTDLLPCLLHSLVSVLYSHSAAPPRAGGKSLSQAQAQPQTQLSDAALQQVVQTLGALHGEHPAGVGLGLARLVDVLLTKGGREAARVLALLEEAGCDAALWTTARQIG